MVLNAGGAWPLRRLLWLSIGEASVQSFRAMSRVVSEFTFGGELPPLAKKTHFASESCRAGTVRGCTGNSLRTCTTELELLHHRWSTCVG